MEKAETFAANTGQSASPQPSWGQIRLRRILSLVGMLMLAALLCPYLPSNTLTMWLTALGAATLADFVISELLVRRSIAAGREGRAKLISAATQTLVAAVVASAGFWGWSPGDDQTNALLLSVLSLLCVSRLVQTGKAVSVATATPLFVVLIIAPWAGGMKVAAEITLISILLIALAAWCRFRLIKNHAAMSQLGEQLRHTEGKLLETQKALRPLKAQSDETQAARRSLLAGLDAEMRNPLAALLQLAEALKEESPLPDARLKQYAAEIRGLCLQLQDFAEDVANLGRIESGSLAFCARGIDLQQLLTNIARDSAERLREPQVSLDIVTFPDLPGLLADEGLVRCMVLNLITDAARGAPPGGRITITALRLPDGGLGLRVSSTGAGLSEADLERVFDSLMSGKPDELEYKGGLGITIVKALAERHGGSLSIRNRLGEGLQATLNFPPERVLSKRPLTWLTDAA